MSDDIISINSGGSYVPLPTPSSYKVLPMSIFEQAERNVEFTMVADLGAVKRQITLSWLFLTPSEFARVCALTGPVSSASEDVFRNVRFYNPTTNNIEYGDFYRDSSFNYEVVGVWDDKPKGLRVQTLVMTER